MLQEKTYSDIKKSLEKDYVYFNRIISSPNIYNSEYKILNSLFKGLTKKITYIKREEWDKKQDKIISFKSEFRPYYTTIKGDDFYGHSLSKEVLDNLSKDFPNIKKDYDLLKARKDKVKLGKRPNNECDEYKAKYQEKLYKQAQVEDKALCGICNKYWEQVDMNGRENILADHGFILGWGQRNGVCFGARYLSWERSPESKVAYIEKVLNPTLKQLSKQKPTGVDLDKAIQQANNYHKLVDEYIDIPNDIKTKLSDLASMYRRKSMLSYGKSARLFVEGNTHITSLEKLIEVKATSEEKKAFELKQKIIKPSIIFSGMRVAMTLPINKDDITLELLTRIWSDHKDQVEAEKLEFETAIKNWKLQLTPREKMNKDKA
jgi:hypothetical protein